MTSQTPANHNLYKEQKRSNNNKEGKRMINKRYLVLSIVIMFLLQIVAVSASVVAHELSHKQDYSSIEKTNESLCFFNCEKVCPTAFACYSAIFPDGEISEVKEIKSYTEVKAYGVSTVIMSSYLLGCLLFIKNIKYDKEVN